MILGGSNISGFSDNTVYVDQLNLFNNSDPTSVTYTTIPVPLSGIDPIGVDGDGFVRVFEFPKTTYITSGSYDNTTGTLNLRYDNNQDIIVTGFTDADCCITGGTYSGRTGDIILNPDGPTPIPITGITKVGGESVVFGDYSSVGAGKDNTIYSNNSFIGGGRFNSTSGDTSTILGGSRNSVVGAGSSVFGGASNDITGETSHVLGGLGNTIVGDGSNTVGGSGNLVLTNDVVLINTSSLTATTPNTVYLGETQFTGPVNYKTTMVDALADPNLTDNDSIVFYNTSGPGGTIYLPTARDGKEVILIRTNNTNSAFVVGSGGAKINGVGIAQNLPTAVYTKTTFISNGTDWYANDSAPF